MNLQRWRGCVPAIAISAAALLHHGCAEDLGTAITNLYIVDSPVFSPPPGNYGDNIAIEMSTTTSGSEIWYTTDGSEPTRGGGTSVQYTAPLPVEPADGAVRYFVRAFRDSMTPSGEVIGAFSVSYTGPTSPVLQVTPVTDAVLADGYWTGAVTVTVSGDPANDAGNHWNDAGLVPRIYYTTNGTLPDSGSSSVTNAVHTIAAVNADGSDVTVNALTGIQGSSDYPLSPAATERIRIRYSTRAADPVITADDGTTTPSVLYGPFTLRISNGGEGTLAVEQQLNGGSWSTPGTTADGDDLLVTIFSAASNGDVVNIRAWADGNTPSELGDSETVSASFSYIQGTLSKPAITPQTGTFTEDVSVTMTTDVLGGSIHYTTDGSPPTEASPVYAGPVLLSGIGDYPLNAIVSYAGAVSAVRSAFIVIEAP